MTHPSHWALDRARLGEVSEEVRAHLAGCATCRAAFAEREVVAVPAWVRQLERPRRRWWLAPGLGLATAALATLLLVVVPRPYVGEKGALPAVAVYLERGGAVAPWAGGALRAGDRLQLTVRPTGRAHVYLLAAGGAGR